MYTCSGEVADLIKILFPASSIYTNKYEYKKDVTNEKKVNIWIKMISIF